MRRAILMAAALMAFAAPPATAATNLIANGSFEAELYPLGWTQLGPYYDVTITEQIFQAPNGDGTFETFAPTDGVDHAFLTGAKSSPSGLYQQIVTTPGQTYDLSLDLANVFKVDIGLALQFDNYSYGLEGLGLDPTVRNYQHIVIPFVAVKPTSKFVILFFDSTWLLDNVSIIPHVDVIPDPTTGVPEPASWALMITGFALTGAALRRRRASANGCYWNPIRTKTEGPLNL